MINFRYIKTYFFLLYTVFLLSCYTANNNEFKDSLTAIEFGRYLFFDTDLSLHQNMSCAICHNPELAFTDGYRLSVNAYAEALAFNTPSILNIENNQYFSADDSTVVTLVQQMERPFFSDHPVEMGIQIDSTVVLNRIWNKYQNRIKNLVYSRGELSTNGLMDFISQYERTLISRNSKYDMHINSNSVLSPQELVGRDIFFNKYNCVACHGGLDFDKPVAGSSYYEVENEERKIKVLGLRNVNMTSPYWHDGSTEFVDVAIKWHSKILGVEKLVSDDEDVDLIIDFLYSLTDTSYLDNSHFLSPFTLKND